MSCHCCVYGDTSCNRCSINVNCLNFRILPLSKARSINIRLRLVEQQSTKITFSYLTTFKDGSINIHQHCARRQSAKISDKLYQIHKKTKKISKKVLTFIITCAIIIDVVDKQRQFNMRMWRNWQTR